MAPHWVGRTQRPPEHSVPRSQAVPLQQGWFMAPHDGGCTHTLLVQTNPGPHTEPAQHGALAMPQAWQLPFMQTLPATQVSPVQQR